MCGYCENSNTEIFCHLKKVQQVQRPRVAMETHGQVIAILYAQLVSEQCMLLIGLLVAGALTKGCPEQDQKENGNCVDKD